MNKSTQKPQRNRGAALLIFVIFFLIISTVLVLGIGRGVYQDLVEYRVLQSSKQSFFGAEAGIEDAIYRHRDGRAYSATESFTLSNVAVNVTRTLVIDQYQFISEGDLGSVVRRSEAWLMIGDGASFNFGLQAGNGGVRMYNSSSVKGNVFSNDSVEGSGNMVYGDVIAAGPSGLLDGIHATGSAWAHTIQSSTIDMDAYYQSIIGSTVSGVACVNVHCHPGSTDQATATMPIPDSMIDDWETGIQTTGTIIASTSAQCASPPYKIDTDTTLNNIKIECDVEISKNSTDLILAGPVWIAGNLTIVNGPNIIASSSLGSRSVQVIVDKPTNRTTSSKIQIQNSTNFSSGNALSYIMLLSRNNSAASSGSEVAIDIANLGTGKVILYAPYGLIKVQNNISLKEVTGYRIALYNSAQIIYESGLMNVLFTSGPGGGYIITSWRETE